MKRRACLALPAALPWLAGCAGLSAPARYARADLQHARALRDAGLREPHALRLARELTEGIGARPAGSDGDRRAAAWAQDALRGLGLQAVCAEALTLRRWLRGPTTAELTAPAARPLVVTALGNSVATPAAGLQADLAWYPDLAALLADGSERAHGRIVVIDQHTERSRDGSGYGRAVAARFSGPVEAARRGALALVIRSIATGGDAAHTGATRYEPGVARIPAVAISLPDADHLAALQATGTPMRMALALQAQSDVQGISHNVIGELPGTDPAGEIVLLGAHLDSWDVGPGALDDAAGVAIVSAAAALIAAAGRRARRTIRVVLFANEENGFDGARAYAQRYADAAHQLVAESDLGAGAVYRLSARVAPRAWPLIAEMGEVLAPLGVALGDNQGSPGPDAAWLMRRQGWPALQLHQDGSRYFDVHHSARDTLDRIDPQALRQNLACWAACAWLAAQSPLPFAPPPPLA